MNQSVIVSRNSRLVNTMYENLGLSEPNWVIINLSEVLPAKTPSVAETMSEGPHRGAKTSRRTRDNVVKLSALRE